MEIKIAAKVDRVDREYFQAVVKPLLADASVEYVGEIGEREKDEFLGNALALLAPINWAEPFGLVFLEALACGTPVVAYNRGSVPELLEPEVTGFVVEDLEEAVEAIPRLSKISRRACRRHFERYFTAPRMSEAYVSIYKQLAESCSQPPEVTASVG